MLKFNPVNLSDVIYMSHKMSNKKSKVKRALFYPYFINFFVSLTDVKVPYWYIVLVMTWTRLLSGLDLG